MERRLMTPFFSVVMPCLNAVDFIEESIASIGHPTIPTEIVVADDGSTDGTLELVRHLAAVDPRIVLVAGQETPSGAGATRNRAIAASRGERIVFLDADDLMSTSRLDEVARQIDRLGGHLHFERVGSIGDDDQLSERLGGARVTRFELRRGRDPLTELLRGRVGWVSPIGLIASREAIAAVGHFDESLLRAEDTDFIYRLVAHTVPQSIDVDQIRVFRRVHQKNAGALDAPPALDRLDRKWIRTALQPRTQLTLSQRLAVFEGVLRRRRQRSTLTQAVARLATLTASCWAAPSAHLAPPRDRSNERRN